MTFVTCFLHIPRVGGLFVSLLWAEARLGLGLLFTALHLEWDGLVWHGGQSVD